MTSQKDCQFLFHLVLGMYLTHSPQDSRLVYYSKKQMNTHAYTTYPNNCKKKLKLTYKIKYSLQKVKNIKEKMSSYIFETQFYFPEETTVKEKKMTNLKFLNMALLSI